MRTMQDKVLNHLEEIANNVGLDITIQKEWNNVGTLCIQDEAFTAHAAISFQFGPASCSIHASGLAIKRAALRDDPPDHRYEDGTLSWWSLKYADAQRLRDMFALMGTLLAESVERQAAVRNGQRPFGIILVAVPRGDTSHGRRLPLECPFAAYLRTIPYAEWFLNETQGQTIHVLGVDDGHTPLGSLPNILVPVNYGEYQKFLAPQPAAARHGQCGFCRAADVVLAAVLSADPDQEVCEPCHADPRVPTVSRAVVGDDRPAYVVSRGDLARDAGREVTDSEVDRILAAIDNGTAPEAISDAVWQVCGSPAEPE